jgi:hypothetical protein
MAIAEIEKLGGKLTVGGSGIGPGMDVFSVDLSSSKVTDAGLVHVKGFAQLQSLDLMQTQVTDAGLEHLNGLTQLRSLNLRGTGITDAGVERLHQALPNCNVAHNAPTPAQTPAGYGAAPIAPLPKAAPDAASAGTEAKPAAAPLPGPNVVTTAPAVTPLPPPGAVEKPAAAPLPGPNVVATVPAVPTLPPPVAVATPAAVPPTKPAGVAEDPFAVPAAPTAAGADPFAAPAAAAGTTEKPAAVPPAKPAGVAEDPFGANPAAAAPGVAGNPAAAPATPTAPPAASAEKPAGTGADPFAPPPASAAPPRVAKKPEAAPRPKRVTKSRKTKKDDTADNDAAVPNQDGNPFGVASPQPSPPATMKPSRPRSMKITVGKASGRSAAAELAASEKTIEKALMRPVTLEVVETPLDKVVEQLARQFDVDIRLDLKALNDVGIDSSTPVYSKVTNLPLRFALDRLLRELQLTWTIRSGTLFVTTPEEAETLLTTRVYNVSSLLVNTPDYPASRSSDLGDTDPLFGPLPEKNDSGAGGDTGMHIFGGGMGGGMMGGGMGGMGGGMGGMGGGMGSGMGGFMNVSGQPASPPILRQQEAPAGVAPGPQVTCECTSATKFDYLVNCITSIIQPTTWDDVGGPGSIAPLASQQLLVASRRDPAANPHRGPLALADRAGVDLAADRPGSREPLGRRCGRRGRLGYLAAAQAKRRRRRRACLRGDPQGSRRPIDRRHLRPPDPGVNQGDPRFRRSACHRRPTSIGTRDPASG